MVNLFRWNYIVVAALLGVSCFIRCSLGVDVTILTDENIESKLEGKNWLLKFYAPWCKHCKTLTPIFSQLASMNLTYSNSSQTTMFGELDATKNPKAVKAFGVTAYPTIIYTKDGLEGVYDGPRTVADISTFLKRLHAVDFTRWVEYSDQTQQNAIDGVTFVLVTKPERNNRKIGTARNHFTTVAAKMKQHAAFALLEDDRDSVSISDDLTDQSVAIVKVSDGKALLTMEHAEGASVADIEEFVKVNNYPLISEFDNHNFKRLSSLNKIIVCAVVDPSRDSSTQPILDAFRSAVSEMSPVDSSRYIFGTLDGVKWKTFIKMYHTMVPAVLVLDQANELHQSFPIDWSTLSKDGDNSKLKSYILSVLLSVVHHSVSMEWDKSLPPTIIQKMTYRFKAYYPYSLVVVILPALLLLTVLFTPYPGEKKLKNM